MQNDTGQLAAEIRRIYLSDTSRAEELINGYLEKKLAGLSSEDRMAHLRKLMGMFSPGDENNECSELPEMEEELLSRVASLLLGREVSQADLSSNELFQRLAESLNTIFDTLNQLVRVINATLFSEGTGDETIRYVIGSHLERGTETKSLETYLGQIQKAFLTTQQAFRNAAHARVKALLDELDPGKISETGGSGFKFGPLRKAECFEMYEKKFRLCQKWFESGRFMEEFMREFENNCQKLSGG